MGEWDGQQARAKTSNDDTQHVAQQPAAPKHTSGAQADQMAGSLVANRATPTNSELAFGEAVVGSNNDIQGVHAPWNLADTPAIASFSVSGDAFELTSSTSLTLLPVGALKGQELAGVEANSPKIAFKPQRSGEARGTLTIAVTWPVDGHVETQTVNLHGVGRGINDAPEHAPASPQPMTDGQPAPAPAPVPEKDKRRKVDYGMLDATGVAHDAAEDLAKAQLAGIGLAEDEASAYKKAVPQVGRSIWWDLAETALTMATGSIASYVSRKLLPRLLTTTSTEEVFTEKVTTTTPGKLPEKLSSAIETSIKTAGGFAIKSALPSKNPKQPDEAPPRSEGHNSSNARIDFFEGQRDLVEAERKAYRTQIKAAIDRVLPLTADHPEQAEQAVNAVASTFSEAADQAKLLEANAVAPAWTSAVARMSLGQETAETANHASRNATQMDETRKLDKSGHVRSANGVLDVYVDPGGRIVSAQMNGVSQEIADRLADMTLSNVPMPVRFILGGTADVNPTVITRDEAGRVRIAGDIKGNDNEANNVKTASSMIDRLLSVPLSSVQLEIKTDDATGRG